MMWAHVLSDLTLEQLIQGVRNLIHHRDSKGGQDFPPNAGQFRDLCLTRFDWEQQCHKVFPPETLLEDITGKEAAREAGAEALAEMKSLFKQGNNGEP